MAGFVYLWTRNRPYKSQIMKPNTISLSLLFICCTFTLNAQVVNMERARMQSDTTGWLGNASADVSLTKSIIQVFSANADIHAQYKSKSTRSLYLFLGSYGFLKGAGQKLIDNAFFHFRYNYKTNEIVRWEVFTQLQQNVISRIKSRFLFGSGPRFKLLDGKIIKLYAGTLIMYEREKSVTVTEPRQNNVRLSSYLSFTITPTKAVELVSTTYFQPLLDDWSDRRIVNQFSLRVKAGKRLGIRMNWNYLNDSRPVAGIPAENYRFGTGIDYDF